MLFAFCLVLEVIVAWAAVYIAGVMARRRQLLDYPNERSSHSNAVPRMGGAAFGLVILIWAVALLLWFNEGTVPIWAALFAGTGIYLLGVADDFFSLPSVIRLVVQGALAAGLLATMGGRMPVLAGIPNSLVWATLWLWLVGLTNAYNFMDGIDGIGGLQAVVAGAYWMFASGGTRSPVGIIGGCIACAASGFLWLNWRPAKIFMGDAGSTLLGFLFAALPLLAGMEKQGQLEKWKEVAAAALVVSPFLLDTCATFIRRIYKRENIIEAHRSHLYQRLVDKGHSHQFVSVLYGVLSAIGAALAFAATMADGWFSFELSGGLVLLLFVVLQGLLMHSQ